MSRREERVVENGKRHWVRRVFGWALPIYAFVMTMAAWPAMRATFDHALGPHDAQLLIVSDASIRNIRVTYDGWPIEARPAILPHGWSPGYFLFREMRSFSPRPIIALSWDGPAGPESLSHVMRQFDSGRLCLYVLRLDEGGRPIPPDREDELAPFWWSCDGWWVASIPR
jgi:hypothetical protein